MGRCGVEDVQDSDAPPRGNTSTRAGRCETVINVQCWSHRVDGGASGHFVRTAGENGADRDRTDNLLDATEALSQLSYGPAWVDIKAGMMSLGKWRQSNLREISPRSAFFKPETCRRVLVALIFARPCAHGWASIVNHGTWRYDLVSATFRTQHDNEIYINQRCNCPPSESGAGHATGKGTSTTA